MTGKPITESYVKDGVKFDDYVGGEYVDAKGPGYANFFDDNLEPKPNAT